MLEQAAETARVLGISEKDALVLEFLALEAWADVLNNNKGRAAFHLGALHAAGQISAETMRHFVRNPAITSRVLKTKMPPEQAMKAAPGVPLFARHKPCTYPDHHRHSGQEEPGGANV